MECWWLLISLWRHLTTPCLLYQAAAAFAWTLRSNASLLALDLSCNALGPAGAQELLAALPHNRRAASEDLHLPATLLAAQMLLLMRPCIYMRLMPCLCCAAWNDALRMLACVCAQDAGRAGAAVIAGR